MFLPISVIKTVQAFRDSWDIVVTTPDWMNEQTKQAKNITPSLALSYDEGETTFAPPCNRDWHIIITVLARPMEQYCFARCRLSASSVTCVDGRPPPARARGRSGGRHCKAGQYGYVSLGWHLVYIRSGITAVEIDRHLISNAGRYVVDVTTNQLSEMLMMRVEQFHGLLLMTTRHFIQLHQPPSASRHHYRLGPSRRQPMSLRLRLDYDCYNYCDYDYDNHSTTKTKTTINKTKGRFSHHKLIFH